MKKSCANLFPTLFLFIDIPPCFGAEYIYQSQTLKNVAYGSHPQQVMDVYFPAKVLTDQTPAPLMMMVHGGAWKMGDKNHAAVVKNKLSYWTKQNWIFVSINYRLVPDVTVQQQTQDIAQALIYIQNQAPHWHADSKRLVLMGHSAGAHLVSLLTVRPHWLAPQPQPWRCYSCFR